MIMKDIYTSIISLTRFKFLIYTNKLSNNSLEYSLIILEPNTFQIINIHDFHKKYFI